MPRESSCSARPALFLIYLVLIISILDICAGLQNSIQAIVDENVVPEYEDLSHRLCSIAGMF